MKRADGILDKVKRLRVVGKSGLDRPLYKNQLRAKIRRLVLHSLLDGRKFLLQRALKRADGILDKINRLRVVGKSGLDRPLYKNQLRAKIHRLILHSLLDSRKFLLQRALKRADGILDKINRLRIVGKTRLDRALDQRQFRAQLRRLVLHRLLNGRELLLQRPGKRLNRRLHKSQSLNVAVKALTGGLLDKSESLPYQVKLGAKVGRLSLDGLLDSVKFLRRGYIHGINLADQFAGHFLVLQDSVLIGLCQEFHFLGKGQG